MDELFYGNWVNESLINKLLGAGLVMVVCSLANSFLFHYPVISGVLTSISFVILFIALYMRHCAGKLGFDGDGGIRLLHRDLIKHLPFKGRGQILDVGCDYGALTIATSRVYNHATVTGVDGWNKNEKGIHEQCERNAKIEKVKKRVAFRKADLAHLDYSDNSFDAVISSYAFHRYKGADARDLVKESLRVLKKGGAFAFQDLFGQERYYGDIDAFIEELKAEGIAKITYVPNVEEGKEYITRTMKTKNLVKGLGMIYGTK